MVGDDDAGAIDRVKFLLTGDDVLGEKLARPTAKRVVVQGGASDPRPPANHFDQYCLMKALP